MELHCPHRQRIDGVCLRCGHCQHDVILNHLCYACGAADIEVTVAEPTLVAPERLVAGRRGRPDE